MLTSNQLNRFFCSQLVNDIFSVLSKILEKLKHRHAGYTYSRNLNQTGCSAPAASNLELNTELVSKLSPRCFGTFIFETSSLVKSWRLMQQYIRDCVGDCRPRYISSLFVNDFCLGHLTYSLELYPLYLSITFGHECGWTESSFYIALPFF